MIAVRRARPGDAAAIGAVHVAAWRSTYPGLLPGDYLAGLSVARQAAHYERAIDRRAAVFVATDTEVPGSRPRVVGFATAGRTRSGRSHEGEIETLYVLDDWRDRGLGRRLIRAAATELAEVGCRSVLVWVLRENPSRWFYERLGGRLAAETPIRFAGVGVVQAAFVWDPIERLLEASAPAEGD